MDKRKSTKEQTTIDKAYR